MASSGVPCLHVEVTVCQKTWKEVVENVFFCLDALH